MSTLPGEFVRIEKEVIGRICKDGTEDRRFTAYGKFSVANGFVVKQRSGYKKAKNTLERVSNAYKVRLFNVNMVLMVMEPENWFTELEKAKIKDKGIIGYYEILATITKEDERRRKMLQFGFAIEAAKNKGINMPWHNGNLKKTLVALVKEAEVTAIQFGLKPMLNLPV
jgi:hypothetical protein